MSKNKYYITTPIYYVNNNPHIGHAYTTIIADVLARYYTFKLGEKNVWFLTGTDEHGAKIAQAAEKLGKSPQEFCDEVSSQFKSAWQNLNISNNDFIRTTEKRHEKVVKQVLSKLKQAKTPKGNDAVFKDVYEGLYCVGCEAYKKQEDLVEGLCPAHNIEPELLSEENWYFRLSDFGEVLKDKIEKDEIKILLDTAKREVLSFIEQGLEDIPISREQVKWGIPVPFDEKQTIYVWVDALINYISALGYPKNWKFKKFWPADIHLLGKDILKFHCVIWPAMLIAAEIGLPKAMFVHGYFTIDGKKMSKTLGNVIDPNDLIKEFGIDAARYLIISQFPFGHDGDVKIEEFKTKYNADLANGLGNLVSRVLSMAEKYCDSKAPNKNFSADIDLEKVWRTIDEHYKNYRIFDNLKEIWDVVGWCDSYIDETKPWELTKASEKDKVDQVVYNLLEIIRQLAWLIKSILPQTSEAIFKSLGDKKLKFDKPIKPGQRIKKGEPLFLRK